ncbi:uncharacterized protein LOC109523738 [Hippocampus comes]|uniref:uncharacterized protein LOC109523738 n=1 Tax=Hippocampus comes TaxID=109280 RepID=UPI00094ED171|nr:PREDICTED: uncharacterized protein LOC109523738 [Hippocampus comes]
MQETFVHQHCSIFGWLQVTLQQDAAAAKRGTSCEDLSPVRHFYKLLKDTCSEQAQAPASFSPLFQTLPGSRLPQREARFPRRADMRTRCNVVSQMSATANGGEPSESDLTGLGVFPGQTSTFKLCAATWSNPLCLAPVRSPLPEPRRLRLAFRVGRTGLVPSEAPRACRRVSSYLNRPSEAARRARVRHEYQDERTVTVS